MNLVSIVNEHDFYSQHYLEEVFTSDLSDFLKEDTAKAAASREKAKVARQSGNGDSVAVFRTVAEKLRGHAVEYLRAISVTSRIRLPSEKILAEKELTWTLLSYLNYQKPETDPFGSFLWDPVSRTGDPLRLPLLCQSFLNGRPWLMVFLASETVLPRGTDPDEPDPLEMPVPTALMEKLFSVVSPFSSSDQSAHTQEAHSEKSSFSTVSSVSYGSDSSISATYGSASASDSSASSTSSAPSHSFSSSASASLSSSRSTSRRSSKAFRNITWRELLDKEIFAAENAPRWVILASPRKWILMERSRFYQRRLLRFDLKMLFNRKQEDELKAAGLLLDQRSSALSPDGSCLLDRLDENSFRHAQGVSGELKYAMRESVEMLGNAAAAQLQAANPSVLLDDKLAQELTGELLRFMYRLLLLFFAESRPELGYLPVGDNGYDTSYSLESLRDLEDVTLYSDEDRNGTFFHDSLKILFSFIAKGSKGDAKESSDTDKDRDSSSSTNAKNKAYTSNKASSGSAATAATAATAQTPAAIGSSTDSDQASTSGPASPDSSSWQEDASLHEQYHKFSIAPLDSRLFDDRNMQILEKVNFPNHVMQKVIKLMSLAGSASSNSRSGRRHGRAGRISYAHLGVNQLGAVYESLLSYQGFFAKEDLYEVHPAGSKAGELDSTCFVTREELDRYDRSEMVLKRDESGAERICRHPRGSFIYRLTGRGRETSASYYTPEVLTRCVVKESLAELEKLQLDPLKTPREKAERILSWKILEPAMGSAAFLNEASDQMARIYMHYAMQEEGAPALTQQEFTRELQKVKMRIADRSLFGVDLNPTAVELGEISIWLNSLSEDRTVPTFDGQLYCGNSLIGCRREAWGMADLKGKKRPRPRQVGSGDLGSGEIWHFLLPNPGMAGYTDKDVELIAPDQIRKIALWRKEFNAPLTADELRKMAMISREIDAHWHTLAEALRYVRQQSRNSYSIYMHPEEIVRDFMDHTQRENTFKLVIDPDNPRSKYNQTGEFQHIRNIMNLWCALWFWPVEDADLLPTRQEFLDYVFHEVGEIRPLVSSGEEDLAKLAGNLAGNKNGQSSWNTGTDSGKGGNDGNNIAGEGNGISSGDGTGTGNSISGDPELSLLGSAAEGELFAREDPKEEDQLFARDGTFQHADPEFLAQQEEAKRRRSALEQVVRKVTAVHHFFHWQLRFADIFLPDPGHAPGFDLILGNPPWSTVTFETAAVLGDIEPYYIVRSSQFNAKAMQDVLLGKSDLLNGKSLFQRKPAARKHWLAEYTAATGSKNFFNDPALYPELDGCRSDLFKLFLPNIWRLASPDGVQGILHPETPYTETRSTTLRSEVLHRIRRHYQFANELKLFADVHNETQFGVNIYGPVLEEPTFATMNNLFLPKTIDLSRKDSERPVEGIKNDKGEWSTAGHPDRLLHLDGNAISKLADVFGTDPEAPILPSIHARGLLETLEHFAGCRRLGELEIKISMIWNETTSQKDGTIRAFRNSQTFFPATPDRLILNGPHLYVGNPLYKTADDPCSSNKAWTMPDLTTLPDDYLPRCKYEPAVDMDEYLRRMDTLPWNGRPVTSQFRLGLREFVGCESERTLTSGILLPGVAHIHKVESIAFINTAELLLTTGLFSSIIVDFYIRTMNKPDLLPDLLKSIPLPEFTPKLKRHLIPRVLSLHSLTSWYRDIWQESFDPAFQEEYWSSTHPALNQNHFRDLTPDWQRNCALRTDLERRQALLETDVLTAQAFGLTLEELLQCYRLTFRVMRTYDQETWYDQKGRIVCTSNKSMGIGLPMKKKKDPSVTYSVNGDRHQEGLGFEEVMDLSAGTVEMTREDTTLPGGPVLRTITYVAPFFRMDREQDYRTAWEFFAQDGRD